MNDEAARKLYYDETANDPVIHCNRFPSWEELSEERRNTYRALVDPEETSEIEAKRRKLRATADNVELIGRLDEALDIATEVYEIIFDQKLTATAYDHLTADKFRPSFPNLMMIKELWNKDVANGKSVLVTVSRYSDRSMWTGEVSGLHDDPEIAKLAAFLRAHAMG